MLTMNKEQTAIGHWLFLALLIIPSLSYGLLNLPNYSVKSMGANGYWAGIIAALFVLPGIVAIYLLAKRFPGQSIITQGISILGSLPGRITGAFYLIYNLVLLTMFTRDIINLVGTYFLDRTPVYIVTFIYLLLVAYAASRGIETIARLTTFIMIPAVLIMIGLVAFSFQNVKWTHVLPIFSPDILTYFKGGFSVLYIYYLIGLSAIALPFLKPLHIFPRLAGGAILFLALFLSTYTFGSIGVFGHRYILHYAWPGLEFVHNINFPYLMLEQAGLIMLIDWIAMIVASTGFVYYTVALGSAQLSGLFGYKSWVWLIFPLKLIMINLPRDTIQTKKTIDLIVRFGWVFLFGYPLVLWLIAVLSRRRGKHEKGKG